MYRDADSDSSVKAQASKLINALLDEAAQIAHETQRSITIEQKPDRTLVTSADKEIERLIVGRIRANFPTHKIVGEEYGNSNSPESDYIWYVDPIDGTQNYANGVPTYGCIIGLHHKDVPLSAGVIHPGLNNLKYTAAANEGAFKNGVRYQIRSPIAACENEIAAHEIIGISPPDVFLRHVPHSFLTALETFHPTLRMYYDCFAMSLASEGALGASVELFCKPWDFAAGPLLTIEAGGHVHWLHKGTKYGYAAIMGKKSVVNALVTFFTSRSDFPTDA